MTASARAIERVYHTRYGGFRPPVAGSDDEVVVEVTSVAQDERDSRVRLLTCDLGDRRCRSGRSLRPLARWAAVLTNPSRP